VLSPAIGLVVTVTGAIAEAIVAGLMPASRHQDHTTSLSACRCIRLTHQKRPPPPALNVRDDRETPLVIEHGMTGILPVILASDQPQRPRLINTAGKSSAAVEIVSSDEQLLRPAT
jgi:hypothetical protein